MQYFLVAQNSFNHEYFQNYSVLIFSKFKVLKELMVCFS
jgi:hypothetical protein